MQLTEDQIAAIAKAPSLRRQFSRDPEAMRLMCADPASLTPDERGARYELAFDVLTNSAPLVERYTAVQDLGPYPVVIVGVPGAYFVDALDYDRRGVYSSLEEARLVVSCDFGEFITSGPE